jgi:hypothetical protein
MNAVPLVRARPAIKGANVAAYKIGSFIDTQGICSKGFTLQTGWRFANRPFFNRHFLCQAAVCKSVFSTSSKWFLPEVQQPFHIARCVGLKS